LRNVKNTTQYLAIGHRWIFYFFTDFPIKNGRFRMELHCAGL